ncbi:MAG: nucleotidyltransferase domain-containing protein, partial [Candidatus Bathyarchaeota archaeon]|nr:nucleotidyltransferase domain-containing protein [Candidatus Bathyarchaeota archaeon]
DNIIFRVYGYFHPSDSYVCDPEYASATIYKSMNPRAPRGKRKHIYYKFYADEGLQLVREKYPRYTIFYEPLQERFVGVSREHIAKTRKPNDRFRQLITKQPGDELLKALHNLSALVTSRSGLSENDFGVFGSLLHGFYHPTYSDIDLIVYGREKLRELCKALEDLYHEENSLRNEFEVEKALEGKRWKFVNYSPKEYLWHQRRKMIYALFKCKEGRRVAKIEFEPVKDWKEVCNEYNPNTRVQKRGWIKAIARVTDNQDAPFIPSIYQIEVLEILEGPKIENIQRILSYVEEFRMQAKRDEHVCVEGNLEEVINETKTFHQITLTYGPRYYEQTLTVIKT